MIEVQQSKGSPARTIHEAFFAAAREHASKVALKSEGGRGKCYTYAEAADLVRRFAAGLHRDGFVRGREIGLLSDNCPEWCLAYLAILAAGCTVVPIDANLKPQEITFVAGHARLQTIVASGRLEEIVLGMPGIRLISLANEGSHGWRKHLAAEDPSGRAPAEVAALIYTSGTTGTPKGVELTHRNILANLEGIRDSLRFDEHDLFLSVLPLHHTFETTCGFITPLTSGCTIAYARSLRSKDILEDIAYNQVTVMCGVPLLFEKMYHSINRGISEVSAVRRLAFRAMYASSAAAWQAGVKLGKTLFRSLREKAGLQTIRMFVSGGAPIPAEIARFFNLIGFDFLQGYGLTECSPVVAVNRPDNIRFGSVGPLLKNVEIRIDSPDQSGVGEITLRSEANTPGYRDNPEATAALMRDGWLYTGDLGCVRQGHLWITGRKKNVIISAAGKNIYPEELEEKLAASPWVAECVVFGRPKSGKQGEEVRAILVPNFEALAADFGIDPTAPDMDTVSAAMGRAVEAVNEHVASYKRITGFEIRRTELEKTSTRKVKRFLYK